MKVMMASLQTFMWKFTYVKVHERTLLRGVTLCQVVSPAGFVTSNARFKRLSPAVVVSLPPGTTTIQTGLKGGTLIKIIPAKQNLGCLALKIADLFYVDTFQLWNGLRGFFINAKRFGRLWITPWRLSFRYEGYFFLQVRPFEKQHKKIYYRNNK